MSDGPLVSGAPRSDALSGVIMTKSWNAGSALVELCGAYYYYYYIIIIIIIIIISPIMDHSTKPWSGVSLVSKNYW